MKRFGFACFFAVLGWILLSVFGALIGALIDISQGTTGAEIGLGVVGAIVGIIGGAWVGWKFGGKKT